jgi:hypothetical protein
MWGTGKRLARKIAWAPRKEQVGVGAGRENRLWRQLPVFPTYFHPDFLLPRGSGYFSSQTLSRLIPHILNRSHTS